MARKDTLKKMREMLMLRREALRQVLVGNDSLYLDLCHQSGGDLADFANESTNGEISSQLIEYAHRELGSIDQALENIRNGEYGKCGGCNISIPIARLEVLPYAKFCIECQRLAEKAGTDPAKIVDWSVIMDPASPGTDLHFKIT